MSRSELLYWLAVLCVGLPSAFTLIGRLRNVTALALSASWIASEAVYYLTGEGMAFRTMFIADLTVIAVIYCKAEWREWQPYRSLRDQFAALWYERSPWDRTVIAIFPVAWIFYLRPLDPFYEYWTLWSLALTQLLLAGWEALNPWLAEHMAKLLRAETTDISGLQRRGGAYG